MSLMYNRKISGPKTVLWGTPDLTWVKLELCPFTTTGFYSVMEFTSNFNCDEFCLIAYNVVQYQRLF